MNRYYEQDEQLYQAVASLMAGDMDSYYTMYDLSLKYLYKIVYDIIKDYHTTEDLVQETYITIYNKISTLQDPRKFYSWAGRIATNITLRYIQDNRRELLALDTEDDSGDFIFDVVAQDTEAFIPENVLMDKERQRLIAQILDGLSVEQKLAVQYFYYEEMSVSEIAETMGCSAGTIKSRLNYARKAIKSAVIDLEINENTRLYSLSAVPLFLLVFRQALTEFAFAGAAGVASAAVGASVVAGEGTAVGAMSVGAGEGMAIGGASVGVGEGMAVAEVSAGMSGSAAAGGVAAGTNGGTAVGVAAGANTGASAGGAVATKVGTGLLGKIGSSMAAKVVTGIVAAGVVTAGGVAIHHIVTEDKEPQPETVPMVIHMESEANVETVDIADDRFAYEYITVTYNDQEITMGFDGNIYQYGYDSYETLSPELKVLHEEKYEASVNANEEDLDTIFGEEIQFTVEGEKFAFQVDGVEIETGGDEGDTSIILTGSCESNENMGKLYEKYQTKYDEKLAALEEEAASAKAEYEAKESAIREYYIGVLKDFLTKGTDPFGNTLEYANRSGMDVQVEKYAIVDVDGDGWSELVVRHNLGELVYGYNPDTLQVVLEFEGVTGDSRMVAHYDYYDSGFLLSTQYNYLYAYDKNSDTYDTTTELWHARPAYGSETSGYLVYGMGSTERVQRDIELVSMYDNDQNGIIWVEKKEDGTEIYYDDADKDAKVKEITCGGNKVEIEYQDISTILSEEEINEITREHFKGIVENFYLNGTDPYGNFCGEYQDVDYIEHDYAIYDVDCDGREELIVRYNGTAYVYGYNVSTNITHQEMKYDGVAYRSINYYRYYSDGSIVFWYGDTPDEVNIYTYDPETDTYVANRNFYSVDFYIYTYTGEYRSDPEYQAREKEILDQYDLDGDGNVWVGGSADGTKYYDKEEFEAAFDEAVSGGKQIELDFFDVSTIVE